MPLFDLSKRLKLRMTGGDRVRFLNGQVTNDVRKANAEPFDAGLRAEREGENRRPHFY